MRSFALSASPRYEGKATRAPSDSLHGVNRAKATCAFTTICRGSQLTPSDERAACMGRPTNGASNAEGSDVRSGLPRRCSSMKFTNAFTRAASCLRLT